MVEAGILDGDNVAVRRQQTRGRRHRRRAAGQDEVADEATVKRLFRENGRVRLQPENDAARADLPPTTCSILGKVVGVFRAGWNEVAPLYRSLDQELHRARTGRQPRVPRLRRVRAAPGRQDRVPGVRLEPAEEAGSANAATIGVQAG